MEIQVQVKEKKYQLEDGSTFLDLAKLCQGDYEEDILLAKQDNRLRELWEVVKEDSEVVFLTGKDPDGRRAYRRSMILLMQKAVDNLLPEENPDIQVLHSLDQSYFCRLVAETQATEAFLGNLKTEMERLVALDLPIQKVTKSTRDAREIFRAANMPNKDRLLRYREASTIHLYNLDGCMDYFYGYMVPSTGYLKYFDLECFDGGFVLKMPYLEPKKVADFHPSMKLHETLMTSGGWSEELGIPTVGALNDAVAKGKARDIILMSEALMEQKIGNLARSIAENPSQKFVMIAGPSSSGKTSFSYRLSTQLRAQGITPHPLSLDDYYTDRDKCPRDPVTGEIDLESIDCLNVEEFNRDMVDLLNGKRVELPVFNFKTGKSERRNRFMELHEGDVMVIEGIHGLNDRMSYSIPKENKFKIYISALTQLSVDEHNPLSTTDGRLIRRLVRDSRTRGTSAEETLAMWKSVRKGEEKNIFPFQDDADVMFNSALIYEMAVLKLYAVPQLYAIDESSPQYPEAKRLLKLLQYFLPIPPEDINNTSLVREFIGGSIFPV
ncbi:MAG: nucleoside kinase [Lachnospiraceae bacterium]|nr:nucleoside kinase [Lachnospiraceae bacterium]